MVFSLRLPRHIIASLSYAYVYLADFPGPSIISAFGDPSSAGAGLVNHLTVHLHEIMWIPCPLHARISLCIFLGLLCILVKFVVSEPRKVRDVAIMLPLALDVHKYTLHSAVLQVLLS